MRILVATLCIIATCGCSSMSKGMQSSAGVGRIAEQRSSFDGASEVSMTPAYVAPAEGGMAEVSLGLSWRSTSPEIVQMLVRVTSFGEHNTISGAALNLDGSIIQLKPVEVLTEHQDPDLIGMRRSDKMFTLPLENVRAIQTASLAKIRVDSGRDYRVGDLKAQSFGNVIVADKLAEFLAGVDRNRK